MKAKIYGSDFCPNCTQAKNYLDMKQVEYEYFTLDEDISIQELNELVGFQIRTVPQIFMNDDYVGGYNELLMLDLDNYLKDDM